MSKLQVYFVPGFAASSKIFEKIKLPNDSFESHFLEWEDPLSVDESIENYASRLCEKIKHKEQLILVGYSFGGMMVQEMSKILNPKKVIIIASIKSANELPNRLIIAQKTKVYKLVPSSLIENLEGFEHFFFTDFLRKRYEIYMKYLSKRNSLYLDWGIECILNWKQQKASDKVIHIHGTKDDVFPVDKITSYIPVENGTHLMLLNKSKTITTLLIEHAKN